MSSDFKSIPIIDASPLLCNKWGDVDNEGVSGVVKQLDQACKEAGFFYVKGHGISDSLIKEVRDMTRKFFDLSYDEKVKIKMSSKTGFRGYQRIGVNVTKGKLDKHEAIDCYREFKPGMYGDLGKTLEGSNKWPDSPSNFYSVVGEYINLLTDLSRNILRGLALALGGCPGEFEGERAGDPFWVMRFIGYPGISDAKGLEVPENAVGCEAHTDYGLLTLVNQDDEIPALQIRTLEIKPVNGWAVPIPGTFVCNISDMLKIWSNGLYESTLHRVPNFDAVIAPLGFCKQKAGGIEKCERTI
ncbi:hypothetical protein MKW92_026959 [Papaver armeniacum]|nr:hypothetical protein MKW92_026959 [Papaver armeniacum]